MSNMSYCRFQNTLADLRECLGVLSNEEPIQSEEELAAARRMIKEITQFVSDANLIDEHGKLDEEESKEILSRCKNAAEED